MAFHLIYVICKNKAEADRISKRLISEKLAACTNSFPVASRYLWKGKTAQGKETVLLVKTTRAKAKKAIAIIERMHSYEVPCIISFPHAYANRAYERWINKSV